MAAEDAVVESLQNLMQAIEVGQEITRELLGRVREVEAQNEKLNEDVASLHLRLVSLEHRVERQHSVRVIAGGEFRTLDELAATLRAEFAADVEAITGRIDHVHDRALRALTDLTEKGRTA